MTDKDDKHKPDQTEEQDDRPVLTMEVFQDLVGRMMRASLKKTQEEERKAAEKSKAKSDKKETI